MRCPAPRARWLARASATQRLDVAASVCCARPACPPSSLPAASRHLLCLCRCRPRLRTSSAPPSTPSTASPSPWRSSRQVGRGAAAGAAEPGPAAAARRQPQHPPANLLAPPRHTAQHTQHTQHSRAWRTTMPPRLPCSAAGCSAWKPRRPTPNQRRHACGADGCLLHAAAGLPTPPVQRATCNVQRATCNVQHLCATSLCHVLRAGPRGQGGAAEPSRGDVCGADRARHPHRTGAVRGRAARLPPGPQHQVCVRVRSARPPAAPACLQRPPAALRARRQRLPACSARPQRCEPAGSAASAAGQPPAGSAHKALLGVALCATGATADSLLLRRLGLLRRC